MKRERRVTSSPKLAQAKTLDGQSDQGVNGIDQEDRVDLKEAVVGEYRFHGSLIRAFLVEGRSWFVAAEVCAALDLVNPRMVVKSLRPAHRGVSTMDTPGGVQTVNLITEGAIYVLVFKSRKPQADAFQSWVTDEVLPQIRRTGSYSANGQIGQDGSIVLPPLDGETRYVVVGIPGKPPHIRRTSPAEMLAENTSLDIQGLCYSLKNIEVWWNKLQILGRSASARDEGFSAHMVEKSYRRRWRVGR
jgi:hypothetical protein